jgi:hypothetical protein
MFEVAVADRRVSSSSWSLHRVSGILISMALSLGRLVLRTIGAYSSIFPRNSRSVASFFAGIRASNAAAEFSISMPFTAAGSVSFAPSRFMASASSCVASCLISSSTLWSSSSLTSMLVSGGIELLSDIIAMDVIGL